MTAALSLAPDPAAPQQARRFIATTLDAPELAEAREIAELLVSELVTNAVVHAASPVEVAVERDDTGIVVRVRDADTGPLVMRAGGGSELDEGGRGFLLVDRLAEAWGTEHQGGRKSVWFRLATSGDRSPEPPEPRAGAGEKFTSVRAAEQKLRTLLLRPLIRRAMTFEEQARELLQRIVDGVDGVGGDLTMHGSTDPLVHCGADVSEHPYLRDLIVDDRRLGTLTVHLAGQPSDDDDCFLELAAERLSLLAAEHGVVRAEQQREAELDYLAEATELLAGSMNVALTLTLATQIVVPRLADWCAAFVVDDRGRPRRVTATHRREDRIDAVHELLDNDKEVRTAIATGATGATQRLPSTITLAGQRSHVAVVPLISRGRTLGVLALGRATPLDAVAFMATLELGRRTAIAVDNARLHEEQVAAANALQASLLPSGLPDIPGLDLAARYHAAAPGLSVGGDFYDAFALPDGSVVVAIGDVCGKGAEAAAVTGTSRDVLRLLLLDGASLTDALRRLNRALNDHPSSSRFCTVALARFDTRGDRVQASVCLAGHPEPVVVRADGSTELVGEAGDLLGVLPDDALGLEESTLTLEPGDALVLYTDGITERRDGRRMFGQTGLRQVLSSTAGQPADAIAERAEEAARSFVDSELRDDLAIVVVRRPTG
ncbi:MAG TPA: SpoIIE family protein phosphatase [Mycobacteriales bacterium]|jgi:serine phosphatase RsbU (regulator of sigma subunit)/anti-sigma regulatory factor (Ser/Thr protein kinase)|nr:SpoIIE family protein phosphatase [Mycobacteriales bacterium]